MTHSNQWLQERADLLATVTEWRERAEAAEAKVARLHDVLEDFARQKKTTELETEYEALNAAFEDAYDMFIDKSRAALKAMENTDE